MQINPPPLLNAITPLFPLRLRLHAVVVVFCSFVNQGSVYGQCVKWRGWLTVSVQVH